MFTIQTVICGKILRNLSESNFEVAVAEAAYGMHYNKCMHDKSQLYRLQYFLHTFLYAECTGLVASTGLLAILLSVCVAVFTTVIIVLIKRRTKLNIPETLEGVETSENRPQSPVYDEMIPDPESVHPSSVVAIDTKQNIAYAMAVH